MALLNPYLQFPGTAREAITAYAEIFGGTPGISSFADFGGGPDGAPAPEGVMHAQLVTDLGMTIMASDFPPGMDGPTTGGNVVCSLSGDEGDALRGYFAALTEGGTISVPLEKQMWGDEFGMCVDRFGISWMVNVSEPAT